MLISISSHFHLFEQLTACAKQISDKNAAEAQNNYFTTVMRYSPEQLFDTASRKTIGNAHSVIVKVKVIAEISARIALLWRSWSIALLWPAWLALNDNAQMLTWKTWAAYCLVNFNQVTDLIV